MSRRPRRPLKRTEGESMMDFYLRNRASVDTSIDLARSCSSKQPYASEGEARAIAAMQGLSGSLFTYQCRYCECWHLTRRPNSGGIPEIIDD
jgi:hypothetical protein